MRHAKSSWAEPAQRDFDRPLNQRGEKAAILIGAYMAQHDVTPDIILCSSSCRTQATLTLILRNLARPKTMRVNDALYLASAPSILAQIRALPDNFHHVLVIGHNPGLEMLAAGFARARCSNNSALRRMINKFPTGALARLDFDVVKWTEIATGEGRLIDFVEPRNLKST